VEITTAKNVQRGLAQKIQDTSGMFRKKQRVYMQSKLTFALIWGTKLMIVELQGHAIKNKDLLAASGAIPIKGAEQFDELQEDVQAVCPRITF
jgi:syntaxin 16